MSKQKKYVRVTKKFILDAIRKNWEAKTLLPGHWLKPFNKFIHDSMTQQEYEACNVCAVGGIFRELTSLNLSIQPSLAINLNKFIGESVDTWAPQSSERDNNDKYTYKFVRKEAINLIKRRDYLSALSVFFEGTDGDFKKTCRFIKDYFPKTIKININGFDLSPTLAGKTLRKEPPARLKSNKNDSSRS